MPYNTQNLAAIADYCKTYWPKEVAHILRIADEVCEQTFLFDLPWDMECTFIPYTFEGAIDWDFSANGDTEWTYMLNRHRFITCLGEAYSLTKDEKYAAHTVALITHWIQHAPLTEASKRTSWRTIDTAIRVESWLKAYTHLQHSPHFTEAFRQHFMRSLDEQGAYLLSVHDTFRRKSNWGIIGNNGLLVYSLFTQNASSIATALSRLEEEVALQVFEDGTHWEQSPMYHNEVLHCLLNVIYLGVRYALPVSETFKQRTKAMCYANLYWAKPDHHQVMQSDSDHTDLRDILTRAAYLFQDGVLKYRAYPRLDFDTVWDVGFDATLTYGQLKAIRPPHTSYALHDSGNYYLRQDWSEQSPYLHFHCGTLGSGHGHADQLHIDLSAYGEDILVDSGRYTYTEVPLRLLLKSPVAHNTTVVDDVPFTECIASWDYGKVATPLKGAFITTPTYDVVSGGHLGYMTLPNGAVLPNREIVYLKPDIFIVIDRFYGEGTHRYTQHFHFNNEGTVTQASNRLTYTGKYATATLQCLSTATQCFTEQTVFSRHYNKLEDNVSAYYTREATGFSSFVTVIHTHPTATTASPFTVTKVPVYLTGTQTLLTDQSAEGLLIEKDGHTYTLVLCHVDLISGVDLVAANGQTVFTSLSANVLMHHQSL